MLTHLVSSMASVVSAGGFTEGGAPPSPAASCAVTGTITASPTEAGIIAGGYTIILTLTNDIWDATVGADNALTTGLIAGIDSAQSEGAGWDAVVKAGLTFANVTRTSDTVVTITLPAFTGYAITATETVTVTVPADNVQYSDAALVASPTISVANAAESCALTGTITGSVGEGAVVAGSYTLIVTVTGDQWVTTLGADNAITTAFLAGITSAQSEATGWNAVVRDNLDYTMLTRDSATQCTLVLPAAPTYATTATETITVTVPATALLASSSQIVATPTFTVDAVACAVSGTITTTDQDDVVAGGRTIILTLSGGVTWDATVGADNAVTTALIAGLDSAQSEAAGWDAIVKAGLTYTAVTRTSDTVATIVLPAFTGYAITATETITVTVPASAITGLGAALVADSTFAVTNVAEAVVLTGTIISGPPTEAHIQEGGKTIIFTVTGDQWVATLGADNAITTAFLAGIDSAQSEATGWDAEVKANLDYTMLTRDSATQCTLVLPAAASYSITAAETITATIPATALLASSSPITASPTVSVSSVSGIAELPRSSVDTTYSLPTGGSTLTVGPTDRDYTTLAAAISAASLGDVIEVDAGETFSESVSLPDKGAGTDWIYIVSSAYASLPAAEARADLNDASNMFRWECPANGASIYSAIKCAAGAHHYRIVGCEFSIVSSATSVGGTMVDLRCSDTPSDTDDFPHHIILDRCYIHGKDGYDLIRGVGLNGDNLAVVDSFVSEIHADGYDSQALCGWETNGPIKIHNCYLEGAGENILIGGAQSRVSNVIPSDITITKNHIYKPHAWHTSGDWTVKNSFELKAARRVLFEGNVIENCWADAQNGHLVMFQCSTNQGGSWTVIEDITMRYNKFTDTARGWNIAGWADSPVNNNHTIRVSAHNNIIEAIGAGSNYGGGGNSFQLTNRTTDVQIYNNTMFCGGSVANDGQTIEWTGDWVGEEYKEYRAIDPVFRDNIFTYGGSGFRGSGRSEGSVANGVLTKACDGYTCSYNILAGRSSASYPGLTGLLYPADNAAIKFTDLGGGDYTLQATSPGYQTASDGGDMGADITTLNSKISGVIDVTTES